MKNNIIDDFVLKSIGNIDIPQIEIIQPSSKQLSDADSWTVKVWKLKYTQGLTPWDPRIVISIQSKLNKNSNDSITLDKVFYNENEAQYSTVFENKLFDRINITNSHIYHFDATKNTKQNRLNTNDSRNIISIDISAEEKIELFYGILHSHSLIYHLNNSDIIYVFPLLKYYNIFQFYLSYYPSQSELSAIDKRMTDSGATLLMVSSDNYSNDSKCSFLVEYGLSKYAMIGPNIQLYKLIQDFENRLSKKPEIFDMNFFKTRSNKTKGTCPVFEIIASSTIKTDDNLSIIDYYHMFSEYKKNVFKNTNPIHDPNYNLSNMLYDICQSSKYSGIEDGNVEIIYKYFKKINLYRNENRIKKDHYSHEYFKSITIPINDKNISARVFKISNLNLHMWIIVYETIISVLVFEGREPGNYLVAPWPLRSLLDTVIITLSRYYHGEILIQNIMKQIINNVEFLPSKENFDNFKHLRRDKFENDSLFRFDNTHLSINYINEKFIMDRFAIEGNRNLSDELHHYLLQNKSRLSTKKEITLIDIGSAGGALSTLYALKALAKEGFVDKTQIELLDICKNALQFTAKGQFEVPEGLKRQFVKIMPFKKYLNKLGNSKLRFESIHEATLEDEMYDIVICGFTHHHMNYEDKRYACQIMFNITRPGGFIGIADEYLTYEQYRKYLIKHKHDQIPIAQECFIHPNEHVKLLQETGLSVNMGRWKEGQKYYWLWAQKPL